MNGSLNPAGGNPKGIEKDDLQTHDKGLYRAMYGTTREGRLMAALFSDVGLTSWLARATTSSQGMNRLVRDPRRIVATSSARVGT
jgi:hypothetical protein